MVMVKRPISIYIYIHVYMSVCIRFFCPKLENIYIYTHENVIVRKIFKIKRVRTIHFNG